MFSIIIPNYNNAEWLDKLFESIYSQTYKDFDIIFVDDLSTDNSLEIMRKWRHEADRFNGVFYVEKLRQKRWNGGARNAGMIYTRRPYVLFIDSDDCFADEHCLEEIAKVITDNNYPDLVRLSYYFCKDGNEFLVDLGHQTTVEQIVNNENVACWTKCVKTEKLVEFPENTLMEDVVQHIKQMDVVDTIAATSKGIVKWNRNNANSCSNNNELQDGKWRSSLYRYFADLLDIRVSRPECQAQLDKRIATTLDNIHNDRFLQ